MNRKKKVIIGFVLAVIGAGILTIYLVKVDTQNGPVQQERDLLLSDAVPSNLEIIGLQVCK